MTALVCLIAVIFRLFLASLGENYDMESWWLVSDLVLNHESVYANTHRYNYGPIWGAILGACRYLSIHTGPDTIHRFHLFVVAALSIADLVGAFVIKRRYGFAPFAFLLLNPVSLLITGYHSQMDGISLTLALLFWDVFVYGTTSFRSTLVCGLLLGLSLSVKHILLPFLPWLLLVRRPVRTHIVRASAIAALGVAIFVLGFLPWVFDPASRNGILKNVIGYTSSEGLSLISSLWDPVSPFLAHLGVASIPLRTVFLGTLTLVGVIATAAVRDWRFLLYIFLASLVALSSGTADQYLAIPMCAVAISLASRWGAAYLGIATAVLLTSGTNIGARLWPQQVDHAAFLMFPAAQIAALGLARALLRRGVDHPH